MKPACALLLLLVPAVAYAAGTCDVTSTEFYNDIKLSSQYGVYAPEIKSCAEVEVMNTSAGNRLTVYITAHFIDGSYQKEGFYGSYVEVGGTRKHKICWNKNNKIQIITCEF